MTMRERPMSEIALPLVMVSLFVLLVRSGFTLSPDLWLLAPDLLILVAASVVLGLGFVMGREGLAFVSASAVGLAAIVTAGQLWGVGFAGLPNTGDAFGILQVDAFALVLKLVFLVVAGLVIVASPTAMPGRRNQGEFYSLLLFATLGMMFVAESKDLMTLFLGFELSSFASYALAAYHRKDSASVEAGMKYFITGSIGSALMLFGISLLSSGSPPRWARPPARRPPPSLRGTSASPTSGACSAS